jgi:hypothetical protein
VEALPSRLTADEPERLRAAGFVLGFLPVTTTTPFIWKPPGI